MKRDFQIWRNAVFYALFLCLAFASGAAPQLVSGLDPSTTPPAGGGGDSWQPILTPDGRYVLFASRANNLVASGSNSPFVNQVPPKMNVFLRDRTNGTTTLVSVNLSGTGPGNGDSIPTALSTNGRFALFESTASDLAPGDTNNATDIFLRDLVNGTNQLISVSTNSGLGNGSSWESSMTPDGRYVAFASKASNLVVNDTNGIQDIFVRDTQTGTTRLASPGAITATTGLSSSDSPEITPDGRFVVFRSTATKLANLGASIANEIYVRDLVSGTTTPVSTNATSLLTHSYNHVISDDGHFVSFETSSALAGVIARYNLQTGLTDIINNNAVAYAVNHFRSLDMTPDGQSVAFVAYTDSTKATSGIFVWNAESGATSLVTTNLDGSVPTNSVCDWPTLDASGRWVAFLCTGTNLTTNAVAGDFHLYVHDLQSATTTLVDAGTNGAALAKDFLSAPRLTPDGRFIAFDSTDADLAPNDTNDAYDVFVGDRTTGASELISVRQPALPTHTPPGITLGSVFSISADGRYLAFSGTGQGLLAEGYTNAHIGVFVRDQLKSTTVLVSVDTNGLAGADGSSFDPTMSADGRYLTFTSAADNLAVGVTNGAQGIFVRDLQTQVTSFVSLFDYTTLHNPFLSSLTSWSSPTISTNGRDILFHSSFSSVYGGYLFMRDTQLGTNYAIGTPEEFGQFGVFSAAMTPDGRFVAYGAYANGFQVWDSQAAATVYTNATTASVSAIAISPDGNRIAYSTTAGLFAVDRAAGTNWTIGTALSGSHSGLQFSGDSRFLVFASATAQNANDTNGVSDVFLCDFQTQSNALISQSYLWPGAANGPSDSPAISPDGRFIAYRSSASDLAPGATNGLSQIFLYDRQTGGTTLVSASAYGDFAGSSGSLTPTFSADSRTLMFQSWASDLVAQDFNQSADFFALTLYTSNSIPAFVGQVLFAPRSGQPLTLTWPAVAGKNYQVQFKDNLNDPAWQDVSGDVTLVGDRGFATDFALAPSHRFYRIVAY